MNSDTLKTYNKKELREKIIELSALVENYQGQLGRLNLENEQLIENLRLTKLGLEKSEKDRKHEQDAKEVLEENAQRLTKELQLAQSSKAISVILESTYNDFKNTLRKIFRRNKK